LRAAADGTNKQGQQSQDIRHVAKGKKRSVQDIYEKAWYDNRGNGFRAAGWRGYSDLYPYHGAGMLPIGND